MKEIQGKIKFGVIDVRVEVPYFVIDDDACGALTNEQLDKSILFSGITEEESAEFVEYYNALCVYLDYGGSMSGCGTAKESLISLLKANRCYTKKMKRDFIKAKARAGRPIAIFDKTEYPDDFLLIKLQ